MPNSFMDAFNPSLDEAERVMGEDWSFNGTAYQAIEIEAVTTEMQAMPGGKFRNVSVLMHVRLAVFTASRVKDGSIVTVRGENLRVLRIGQEGDDSREIFCGPAQINTSGLL